VNWQSPQAHARRARQQAAQAELPSRVGPVEFGMLGATVVVRCLHDLDR
jgi:hypothetical protein